MQEKHTILGVHITDRLKEALEVQKLLTTYGASVKTRLGLHEVREGSTGPNGILLLEMTGADAPIRELSTKLAALPGVEVKSLVFTHGAA